MNSCTFNPSAENEALKDRLATTCRQLVKSLVLAEKAGKEVSVLKPFVEACRECAKDLNLEDSQYKEFKTFIEDNILGKYKKLADALQPFFANDSYLTAEGQVYERLYDDPTTEKYPTQEDKQEEAEIKGNYLTKAYGPADAARALEERNVRKNLVKSILIDLDAESETKTDNELNSKIQAYQESLFQKVIEFLISKNPGNEELKKQLQEMSLKKDGLDFISKNTSGYFKISRLIEEFPKYGVSKTSTLYVDAYNALVTLKNFDSFISEYMGSFVGIRSQYLGQFDKNDKYYISGTGANLIETWRDDNEDIELSKETSAIVRSIADNLPYYRQGHSNPDPNRNLGLNSLFYITGLIKNLVYHPASFGTLFKGDADITYKDASPEFKALIDKYQGWTLRKLISKANQNGMVYYKDLFTLLTNNTFITSYEIPRVFKDMEKDILYSVYKNIFSESHSLYAVFRNDTTTPYNYYSYLVKAMQDVDKSTFMQYKKINGEVVQVNMHDSLQNETRRRRERAINANLTNLKPNPNSKTNFERLEEKYGVDKDSLITTKNQEGTEISLLKIAFDKRVKGKDHHIELTFAPTTGRFDAVVLDGQSISVQSPNIWDIVKDFVGDTLSIDFSDSDLTPGVMERALLNACTDGDILNLSNLASIINLAGKAFFNAYFSHHILEPDSSISTIRNKIKEVYGPDSDIQVSTDSSEVNAISNKDIAIMDIIANAYDYASGAYASGMSKDGAGNMINSISCMRLTGNYMNQVYEKIFDTPNAAASHFTIINSKVFKGIAFARDFSENRNSKKITKFTTKEFMYASLMTNFIDVIHESGDSYSKRYIALFPAPTSDKGQILELLIDPKGTVNLEGELGGKYNGKLWAQLSEDALWEIAHNEIGNFYKKVKQNVAEDWHTMSLATRDHTVLKELTELDKVYVELAGMNFTPDNNFMEFNEWCQSHNMKPTDVLHDLEVACQHSGFNTDVKIIDQTHYVKTKKGLLQANRGFSAEISKAFDLTAAEDFKSYQNAKLTMDLLRADFKIDLYNDNGKVKSSKSMEALSEMSNWVNKSTGRMILAKVKVGDKTYNLTKLSDLEGLSYDVMVNGEMRTINYNDPMFKLDDFINLTDGASIEVHPDVGRMNAMQYLFGQEYILSSVGHQYNHPDKKFEKHSLIQEEAARFAGQHKRNVSQTASKHSYTRGLLQGVVDEYNIAVVGEEYTKAFNLINSKDGVGDDGQTVKPYDGCTFVAPDVVYLENNSLRGDAAGVDKKPFVHSYDARTGSGVIIKTAGFGVTNARINMSSDNSVEEAIPVEGYDVDSVSLVSSGTLLIERGSEIFTISPTQSTYANKTGVLILNEEQVNKIRTIIPSALVDAALNGTAQEYIDAHRVSDGYKKDKNGSYTSNGTTIVRHKQMPFYKRMTRNMWNLRWKGVDGQPIDVDITKNYLGQDVIYDPIFFRGCADVFNEDVVSPVEFDDSKFYQVKSIVPIGEPNSYKLIIQEVDNKGRDIPDAQPIEIIKQNIDTNYKLWQMFGAEFSMAVNKDTGVLEASETSITNIVKAECQCAERGIVKTATEVQTQDDIWQPLKHAVVHYCVTEGAIKQGAANMNSNKAYKEDNYQLATFKVKIADIGVQLNAEHHADEAVISLMTQVVNALSARGYMNEEAEEVYRALAGITEDALQGYTDELGKLLPINDPSFQDKLAQTIVKALKRTTARDGNLLQTMAEELVEAAQNGGKITSESIKGKLPLSHPGTYAKIVSILTSALSQSAIKMKFKGTLSVLNPSFGIYKLHGDKFRGQYRNREELEREQLNYNQTPITDPADLQLGRVYRIIDDEHITPLGISADVVNNSELITLSSPKQYWELRSRMRNNPNLKLVEDIREGRDLGAYNFTFVDTNGEKHNMWDLDVVKYIYAIDEDLQEYYKVKAQASQMMALAMDPNSPVKPQDAQQLVYQQRALRHTIMQYAVKLGLWQDFPEDPNDKSFVYALRGLLQKHLGAVSNGTNDKVIVDGREVQVRKSSLNIIPYEVIMPKIYATRFGLQTGDSVSDVLKDEDFFLKRMGNAYELKGIGNDYHIALRRANGDHTYLMETKNLDTTNLTDITDSIETIYKGDKLYRIDHEGNVLYQMQKGDHVFKNANGKEIVVSDNVMFYIEGQHYDLLTVNSSYAQSGHAQELLEKMQASDKGTVKSFFNTLQNNLDSNYEEKYLQEHPDVDVNSSAYEALLKDSFTLAQQIIHMNEEIDSDLEAIRNNLAIDYNSPIGRMLKKINDEKHTSFVKSLDVLAARIPAQSMQSFMAMRCAGFDNSNLNSAYVSHYQFWLQGSDLDIDKVSLLGYEFGRDGRYIGWSPYFDIETEENLKESENLPFPTGLQIQLIQSDDEHPASYIEELVKGNLRYDSKKKKFIIESRDIPLVNRILRESRSGQLIVSNPTGEVALAIKKLVDTHNLYFQKHEAQKVSALKNFVSTYMFKISSSPINLIQSQSPIDEPVDILKEAASTSVSESWDAEDTPGNYMAVVKAFIKNMVGKDCVAISASGMKTVEGLTYYVGSRLRTPNDPRIKYLLTDRNICGKHITMLANSYADPSLRELLPSEVNKALSEIDQSSDAMLLISAILGAAVDNAKDPILGKINGGSDVLPMYIYGIAMGIPFKDLSTCMMSSVARNVSKLAQEDVFSGKSGMQILVALRMIRDGLQARMLNKSSVDIISKALTEALHVEGKTSFPKLIMQAYDAGILENLRSLINTKTLENNIPLNRDLELIDEWIQMHRDALNPDLQETSIDGKSYYAIDALIQLAEGAAEFSAARPMYGLNKQVANDDLQTISFLDKFETIFQKRLGMMESAERKQAKANLEGFPALMEGVPNPNFRISFERFMTDPDYQRQIIDYYDKIKHSINIFDAVMSDPKYEGYMKAQCVAVAELESTCKFRAMHEIAPEVYRRNHIYTSFERIQAARSIRTMLDSALVNKWFRVSQKNLTIPLINNLEEGSTELTTIQLGTNEANASFLNWMESEVIPDLREGILEKDTEGNILGRNIGVKSNTFIKGLMPTKTSRTLTGNAMVTYVPSINTMPKTPYEKEQFQKWKQAFGELFSGNAGKYIVHDIHGRSYSYNIGELFFYYNLISNNAANGQATLSTLFEDLYADKSSSEVIDYNKFISTMDLSSDLIEGVDYSLEDALLATAPEGRIFTATSAYVKVRNRNYPGFKIYRRLNSADVEEETANFEDDEEGNFMDYGMDGIGEGVDEYDIMSEMGVDEEEDESDSPDDRAQSEEEEKNSRKYSEVDVIKSVPWGFEHKQSVDFDYLGLRAITLELSPEFAISIDAENVPSDSKTSMSKISRIYYRGKELTPADLKEAGSQKVITSYSRYIAELTKEYPNKDKKSIENMAELAAVRDLNQLIDEIQKIPISVIYNGEKEVLSCDTAYLDSLLHELFNTEC